MLTNRVIILAVFVVFAYSLSATYIYIRYGKKTSRCQLLAEAEKGLVCFGTEYEGEEGNVGATGVPGAFVEYRGATGQQGPTGSLSVGATGDAGVAGEKGATGDNLLGISGDDGDIGDTGPVGVDGPTGLDVSGNNGATGVQGDRGESGPIGDTGLAGDPSVTQGAQGPQGESGAIGLSVRGNQGSTGIQGAAGDSGAVAYVGPTGDTGVKGEVGDTGDDAATGAVGDTGAAGVVGEQGIQGPLGARGETGLSATGAPVGNVGATGAIGAQGSQGEVGVTGAVGPGTGDTTSLAIVGYWRDSLQTIPNDVGTLMTFPNDEVWNIGVSRNGAGDRWTFDHEGYYFICATLYATNSNSGIISLFFEKNNDNTELFRVSQSTHGNDLHMSTGGCIYMNVGEYLQLKTYQNSGGNINLSPGGGRDNKINFYLMSTLT